MHITTSFRTLLQVFSRPELLIFCLLFGVTPTHLAWLPTAQAAELSQAGNLDRGNLEAGLPASASNAALHYQRALLFLAEVDRDQQKLLSGPIWKIIHAGTTEEEVKAINDLLIESRHAIRAALVGASQLQADFGADSRQYAATTLLPHVVPMSRLAKLVVLHGMQRQSVGNWREAAQIYLDVVRMGRHMSQQLTLAESIEAVRILETGYHALANWAVECPDAALIAKVRSLLNAVSPNSISPAAAISREATLLRMGLSNLQSAYPDGNWAEMILVAFDAKIPSLSSQEMRTTARAMARERGVPESVFDSKESFDAHVDKLRVVNRQYYEELLSCFTLPASQAVREGARVHEKYASQLKRLGDPNTLNASRIAAYYAVLRAEHQLVHLILSLSAHKQDGRFPQDLSTVAADFGGTLPGSPYSEEPVAYSTTENGNGLRIGYPEAKIGNVVIPEVAFEYAGNAAAP